MRLILFFTLVATLAGAVSATVPSAEECTSGLSLHNNLDSNDACTQRGIDLATISTIHPPSEDIKHESPHLVRRMDRADKEAMANHHKEMREQLQNSGEIHLGHASEMPQNDLTGHWLERTGKTQLRHAEFHDHMGKAFAADVAAENHDNEREAAVRRGDIEGARQSKRKAAIEKSKAEYHRGRAESI
ncbi:hypothetical protein FRC19_006571 [Serendipita sp. 401]|nr:hypothetical protein FRC18_007698 [Serendipita sp. 400]KAG8826947.1 hypothetical protein FRC19_006571 [Serendipita sp. 401]KAG9057610.1 hypothetical protein FS842_005314 [Serendipita sp. 407]